MLQVMHLGWEWDLQVMNLGCEWEAVSNVSRLRVGCCKKTIQDESEKVKVMNLGCKWENASNASWLRVGSFK